MADLVTMTRATAIASGRWSEGGECCRWLAWATDPDATERPVVFWSHGGAETNWEDLELPANDSMLMLANELGAVVISYDVSPGFFRFASGEGTAARDVFAKQREHMAAIAWFRTHMGFDGNTILPSGMWITTDPDLSMHAGSSSGGYDVWRAQLAPAGSLSDPRGRVVRGEGAFARTHDHRCNFLFVSIAQSTLSQFCEYVTSDPGDSTYVTSGTTAVGATSIGISGDTIELLRANRILLDFASDYTTTGTQNTNTSSLEVGAGTGQLKAGTTVVVNLSGTDHSATVTADYAGGAGTIAVGGWSGSSTAIPTSTAVRLQQEFAVMDDTGTSPSSVDVWPSAKFASNAGATIVLQHHSPETYGALGWAQSYLFPASSGYVWRSDDADGFPLAIKRQADPDYLLDVSNPRVHEINVVLTGPTGTSLVSSSLTRDDGFLNWYTPGEINPRYIDLHDEAQSMYVAHWLTETAGNPNVAAYLGNVSTNVNVGDGAVPWNLGRNSAFSASVLQAFLEARGW